MTRAILDASRTSTASYGASIRISSRSKRSCTPRSETNSTSSLTDWICTAPINPMSRRLRLLETVTAATRLRPDGEAEAARERQVVALTDLDARHRNALPTIIAGDLNATPQAASMRYLTGLQSLGGRSVCYHDAWAVAGDGPGYTWTVDNPNAQSVIDQIVRQPTTAGASTTS